VLHQEEDEAAQMQPPPLLSPSPTGDACASYLIADRRRNSKFGGESEGGGRNRRWGATGGARILPVPFSLFAVAPAIFLLVFARAPKISFCISFVPDLGDSLETAN
jgi:hypothetical protein